MKAQQQKLYDATIAYHRLDCIGMEFIKVNRKFYKVDFADYDNLTIFSVDIMVRSKSIEYLKTWIRKNVKSTGCYR